MQIIVDSRICSGCQDLPNCRKRVSIAEIQACGVARARAIIWNSPSEIPIKVQRLREEG